MGDALLQKPLDSQLVSEHVNKLIGIRSRVGFIGVEETLQAISLEDPCLTYGFTGGLAPYAIKNHAGRVSFQEEGTSSLMVWSMNFDAVPGPSHLASLMFQQTIPL